MFAGEMFRTGTLPARDGVKKFGVIGERIFHRLRVMPPKLNRFQKRDGTRFFDQFAEVTVTGVRENHFMELFVQTAPGVMGRFGPLGPLRDGFRLGEVLVQQAPRAARQAAFGDGAGGEPLKHGTGGVNPFDVVRCVTADDVAAVGHIIQQSLGREDRQRGAHRGAGHRESGREFDFIETRARRVMTV